MPIKFGANVANSIVMVVIIKYSLPKKPLIKFKKKFPVGITLPKYPAISFDTHTITKESATPKAISFKEISFLPQYWAAKVSPSSVSTWSSTSSI